MNKRLKNQNDEINEVTKAVVENDQDLKKVNEKLAENLDGKYDKIF